MWSLKDISSVGNTAVGDNENLRWPGGKRTMCPHCSGMEIRYNWGA